MEKQITIETPRGTFRPDEQFSTLEAARNAGWGLWFVHGDWCILSRDGNGGGAVAPWSIGVA